MKRKNNKKSNIIMTLALICAITIIALLPLPVAQAASFTVSKSNLKIEKGKSSTITINAPTHTGRLDIVSSNSGVATVSESNLWVENNSKTITISAKSAGTAMITIKGELYDSSTEEEATFIRTVNVTVTKAASSDSTNTGGTSSGGVSNGNSSSGSVGGNQTSNTTGSSSNSTNNSGGQSSSTTSKPSTGTTSPSSSSSNSGASKPSSSSSSKPSSATSSNITTPNNTIESTPSVSEENATIIQEENTILEEQASEEMPQEESQENIIEQELNSVQTSNVESANSVTSNGRIIMIAIVGVIAIAMIFIGIGVSKNIFKK